MSDEQSTEPSIDSVSLAGGDLTTVRNAETCVLLIMVVASTAILDDVITVLLDIDIAGTVVESKGLMALLREEMPIFGGLASMLPETTGSRVVLSVCAKSRVQSVFDVLRDEFDERNRPLALTVPIEQLTGFRF